MIERYDQTRYKITVYRTTGHCAVEVIDQKTGHKAVCDASLSQAKNLTEAMSQVASMDPANQG